MKRLQSLSYKTLFAILFFALAGIVFFIKIGGKTTKVSAAWWDEMWHYRKAISIDNSSGSDLTDFQVALSIGTSQLIADGKMQNNCNDIRITDINGNLLPYWIEENNPGCNSASGDTKVWLKASSLPTSGSTVYLYYGNTSADNNENGNNVFEFFDDFSTNLNKWINVSNSNWNVSSGILNITPSSNDNYLVANQSIGISGFTIEGRIRANSSSSSHIGFIWHANTSTGTSHRNDQIYLRPHSYNTTSNAQPGYFNGGLNTFSNSTGLFNYNTWYTIKVEVPTSNSVKYYRDDVNENNFANQQYQTNTYTGVVAHAGTNVQWDNFRVRKYVSSTPTTSPQSEEIGTGPIAYWKFDSIYNDYAPLEYIQTSANQYINTGVNPKTSLSAELTIALDNGSLDQKFFGAYNGSIGVGAGTIYGKWRYGSGGWSESIINASTNKTVIKIADYQNNYNWYINNDIIATNLPMTNYSSPIYLIGINYQGSLFGGGTSLKLYGSKIWDSGTLIRDFIPVKRISDNNIGLYDTINNVFYPNAGTGTFTAGPEITYDSTNTNHGTLGTGNSAPTWADESQCISGKCLSFDGTNDYVDLANLNNSGTSYTFSFWINSKDSTTGARYFFDVASGRLLFGWGSDTAGKIGLYDGSWKLFGNSPSINIWHHVEFVLNGSTNIAKMYLDGSQYGSDLSFTPHPLSGSTSIGSRYSKNSNFFNGLIDEVKIYPYARTAAQIKLDYNSRGSLSGSSVNLGVQSNTAPSLKSSLITHYKFDENNGTIAYDSSENNLNGTFGTSSSSPTWAQGKINKSLSFDGSDDFLSITDNDLLDTSNDYTISMWVYNQAGAKSWPTLLNRASSSSNNGYFWIYTTGTNGSNINFQYADGTNYHTENFNNALRLNSWDHISFTFNNSTKQLKLYINGKQLSTAKTLTNALPVDDGSLYIGTYQGNPASYPFKGSIDELKIYNRALTADEVKQDYNQGSAISFGQTTQNIGGTTTSLDYCIPGDTSYCASPIAEWKMDEGVGTSIVDTSGNNNTGTLVNSPTWAQGKIGKALQFSKDSNNYIQIDSNKESNFDFTTALTAQVWVNISSHDSYSGIFSKTDSNTNGWEIRTTSTQGQIQCRILNGTDLNASTIISLNEWQFLTCTYSTDDNKIKLYVNGQLKASATGSNGISTNDRPVLINGLAYVNHLGNTGTIDQVRVYDYARTPAQIAYDYNKGGPVGWWKFDECQGNIAYDWSGNNNNGTINIGSGGTQNSLGTCTTSGTAWGNGATGKINSSLNFDGTDDNINIGDPSNGSLDFGVNDFTTSAWFKTTTSNFGVIIGKYSGYPLFYTKINTGGVIESRIGFDSSTNFIINDGNTVNDNKWHQIITIFKRNGQMTRYLDGKILGSSIDISSASSRTVDTTNNLVIGSATTTQYFPGQIDDVRIYNYALTSEQVKNIYNNGAVSFN